ncbi:hypothetical protein HZF02_24850 [Pseudomonas yamanorum]|nr:hypothetical protein HZF02_24850 [Pseudomonas yamanorum]
MIKIKLWPDLVDWKVNMSVKGMRITIDGEEIDLSVIPDGHKLPGSAVNNRWFVAHEFVERVGNDISLTLRYPVEWESPPEPIVIECGNGKVYMPDSRPKKQEIDFKPNSEGEKND